MRDRRKLVPGQQRYVGQGRGVFRGHVRHDRQVELGGDELITEERDVVGDGAQVLAQLAAVGGAQPVAPGGGRVDELLQVPDNAVVFVEDLLQDVGDIGRAAQLVQFPGQGGQRLPRQRLACGHPVRRRDRRRQHDARIGGDREADVLELAAGTSHGAHRSVVRGAIGQRVEIEGAVVAEVVLAQYLVEERVIVRHGGDHTELRVDTEGDVGLELQFHAEGFLRVRMA
ncbi:hypothetical protein [Streptomyces sp. TRM68416]|uniref:hypothetical protein n=1 Tax=Streptomyces sp. TRM68416 TaxID=2758412 RepID=UPI001661DAEE|nr:hypothetical protein [Streptomyces sp. TRM68416]MBD0844005.1 hypothetical protein [Streptomyces sp. TRM68416]